MGTVLFVSDESSTPVSASKNSDGEATPVPSSDEKSTQRFIITLVVGLLIGLLVRLFVIGVFTVPSVSMQNTLDVGDRIMVEKLTPKSQIKAGDVVVFDGAGNFSTAGTTHYYVKRVIAVGGDTVEDTLGVVSVNGKALDEPYLYQNDDDNFGPVKVPSGELWVMGDHRARSGDSRVHGPIPQDSVVGRTIFVYWPLNHFKEF